MRTTVRKHLRWASQACRAQHLLGKLRARASAAVLLFSLSLLLGTPSPSRAEELPEYRLKAAFLYNFAVFTEWPSDLGNTLNLCIVGRDPFGKDIDELQGKAVGERSIAVLRKAASEPLKNCQMVFITESAIAGLPKMLEELRDRPVLTVADCTCPGGRSVALNMSVVQNKVAFEANLQAVRSARLTLSSKLLRLATKVRQ
jgi:hypothetical protein